jgi:hypothetical protein
MLSTRTCGYYFPRLYDFSLLRDRGAARAAGQGRLEPPVRAEP